MIALVTEAYSQKEEKVPCGISNKEYPGKATFRKIFFIPLSIKKLTHRVLVLISFKIILSSWGT